MKRFAVLAVFILLAGCGGGGGGSAGGGGNPAVIVKDCTQAPGLITERGTVLATTGNPDVDIVLGLLIQDLTTFFNVPGVNLFIIDEFTSPNAFSTDTHEVVIGKKLLVKILTTYGEEATAGIVAHEMGHQAQFHFFPQEREPGVPGVCRELEADAFAGYYLGSHEKLTKAQTLGFFAALYEGGDNNPYDFINPDWHGTSVDRVNAASLGFDLAKYAVDNHIGLTPQDLHRVLYQCVVGRVARVNVRTWGEPEADAAKKALAWLQTH